ncbi:MAG: hypothetical protein ACRDSH_05635 [Pseudonocardiaceae bacterium]
MESRLPAEPVSGETPSGAHFDQAYLTRSAPWVIREAFGPGWIVEDL